MSKHKIREDKTCLNCNYVVAEKFCPNCGQENTDTRKTFHHLFIHFFEDLTHYENSFWRTIKNLLFKPASLTKEYLSGKRMSYLAPVRLYIFMSFVTFLVVAMLPETENLEKVNKDKNTEHNIGNTSKDSIDYNYNKYSKKNKEEIADSIEKAGRISKERERIKLLVDSGFLKKSEGDTISKNIEEKIKSEDEKFSFGTKSWKNLQELDSIQKFGKPKEKVSDWEYKFIRKMMVITTKYKGNELKDKFLESFTHNFPKALFIYMPIFAFLLWLFHSKKRWYYFDHGIFTLHYFSFLLLIVLTYNILDTLNSAFLKNSVGEAISDILNFGLIIWGIIYFFMAHKKFYEEKGFISFVKSGSLFLINSFLMSTFIVLYIIFTFLSIH